MAHRFIVAVLLVAAAGCGGDEPSFQEVAPAPRRLVMWLESEGLDETTAAQLQAVGVDEVVQWRGTLDLQGQAPFLEVDPVGKVEGSIPLGIALRVSGVRPGLDEEAAEAVWRALERQLDGSIPAELILDLPDLAEGIEDFMIALRDVSGVEVVPILSFNQLLGEEGRRVAGAMRSCLVPAFGTDGADLRGIGERDPLPLKQKLQPIASLPLRVRLAIVLRPRTDPVLNGPGGDLDPLTERRTASMSTSSSLDRSFTFARDTTWSGRDWKAGESVAIRWMDASRLRYALKEIQGLFLPEVGGWDLVTLPSEEQQLGLDREGLFRYLRGEGPEPELAVNVSRNGRTLRVSITNQSPFGTAVSNHGNWVQFEVAEGWIRADGSNTFDRMTRGTLRNGKLEEGDLDRVNAVRFFEIYLAPGEEIVSGTVRVPSSGTKVLVKWRFSLFDGSEVTGERRDQ